LGDARHITTGPAAHLLARPCRRDLSEIAAPPAGAIQPATA